MKVQELIDKLKTFDPNLEVQVTDGYDFHFYHTNACLFAVVKGDNPGEEFLDIGIGDCREDS